MNPKVRLHVGHQQSQFWPILARFLDYYSLFWGPRVISMINEPWGAFTCRSSTLAVLADSSPFVELLLTILGSRSDFHSCWTPRCAYVLVINSHSIGQFWPVSWTITDCFGVPEWFPRLTNPMVRLSVGHQHSWFLSILARFMDYYSLISGPWAISMIDETRGAFMYRWSITLGFTDSWLFHGL